MVLYYPLYQNDFGGVMMMTPGFTFTGEPGALEVTFNIYEIIALLVCLALIAGITWWIYRKDKKKDVDVMEWMRNRTQSSQRWLDNSKDWLD
jgi:hypothetical protein